MAQKYRKEKPKTALLIKTERQLIVPAVTTEPLGQTTPVGAAKPASQTTPSTASPLLLIQGGEQNQDHALPANATLQQQRAHFALTRIQTLAGKWQGDTEKQKKFNSYASAMPFMIHANGLGQTAAFYRCKGEEDVHCQLYQLVGEWLSQNLQPFSGKTDLLDGVTQSDLDHYIAAQAEAMRFLDWVKKLANAFMDGE
jgi:CRISPR-associated protein Cmr5